MSLKALLAASLVLAAGTTAALGSQTLRIVDPEDRPVAGARLELAVPQEAWNPLSGMLPFLAAGTTDVAGSPPFRLPFRDHLLLLVNAPAFRPLARELAPHSGELRIALERGRTWQGKVTLDRETAGGRICASWKEDLAAWNLAPVWQRCADLSSQGDFTLIGLGAPEVEAEVQVPGYLVLRQRVALASPGALRPRRGLRLRGRVIGPGAGVPIAKATVRSDGSVPIESGTDGAFATAVRSLPAFLEVSAPGFRERRIAVKERPKKGIVIVLERGEQLRGFLADPQGHTVPEARFWIERSRAGGHSRSEEQSVRTERGAFLLDLPEPGSYRLRIGAQGFRAESLPEISMAPGESRSLGTIVLRRGAGVAGLAVDAKTGGPLAGVDVEVQPEGPQLVDAVLHQQSARTVSDREGRFTISGLGAGRFSVTAQRSGYAPALLAINLDGTQVEDLETVRMEHGTLLRGKVTDREGNPRSALTVRLFRPEPGSLVPLAERTTAPDGTFEGPSIASGRYRIQVWGGRLLLTQEIEVPDGREEWPLELVAGGVSLTGVVTRGGEPVAGGSLSFFSKLDPAESRGKIHVSSEDAGTFTYGFPETRLSADVRDDGTFEVADAPAGTLRVDYTGPGAGVTREVQVPDGARASLTLEIGGVPLRGRILDRAQNAGVEGTLRVTDGGGSLVAVERSDPEGAFQVADLQTGRYTLEATAEDFLPRVLPGVEVGPATPPVEIALDRGESGSLRAHLDRADGSPAAWIPLTLLDQTGRVVAALPTDTGGEQRFKDLPGGVYVLVWTDPFAGTGASEPLRIESGRESSFQRTLSEGASVQLHCDLDLCAGQTVEALTVATPAGTEIGPYLSGISPALRFSSSGVLTLGRLSPGSYSLRVSSRGQIWNKTFTVGADEARIALP